MVIGSSASNLVSAIDSCGQVTQCNGMTPCAGLMLPPPPQGGACAVTITFSDHTTIVTQADWGAEHDTPCCGKQYDHPPIFEVPGGADQ
jgi:hypothetical protein